MVVDRGAAAERTGNGRLSCLNIILTFHLDRLAKVVVSESAGSIATGDCV
ncbi:hypothetical protein PIPA1_43510 [Pelosinus sp. IPA-1]|nr:hypothetical protein PIPA1_43510 [Pelosinus sp. IPA-1]